MFFSIYSGLMSKKPISIPAQKPNTSRKKHVSGSEQFRIERISEFVEEFGIERICFITETKRSHKDQASGRGIAESQSQHL
jgi:hypothetical protein